MTLGRSRDSPCVRIDVFCPVFTDEERIIAAGTQKIEAYIYTLQGQMKGRILGGRDKLRSPSIGD